MHFGARKAKAAGRVGGIKSVLYTLAGGWKPSNEPRGCRGENRGRSPFPLARIVESSGSIPPAGWGAGKGAPLAVRAGEFKFELPNPRLGRERTVVPL